MSRELCSKCGVRNVACLKTGCPWATIERREMKIETFKCATGSGWGIQVEGFMDCDVPYSKTEALALAAGCAAYPGKRVLTTADKGHYAYKTRKNLEALPGLNKRQGKMLLALATKGSK